MALRISDAAANAGLDAILALLNSGTIEVWTGSVPGSLGGSEGSNTLLGTLGFNATAFRAAGAQGPLGAGSQPATARVAYANAITPDTSADASGTAGHFRAKTSGATVVMDGTCGAGSGDASFDVVVVVSGGTISVVSMKVQM